MSYVCKYVCMCKSLACLFCLKSFYHWNLIKGAKWPLQSSWSNKKLLPFWFRNRIQIRNPFVYMSARMYVYPLTVSLLSPYCYLRQACILRSFHYRNAFLSINLCLSKKCFFVNGHSRYWLVFLKLADIQWQPKSIDDFKFSILNKIINSTECLSL